VLYRPAAARRVTRWAPKRHHHAVRACAERSIHSLHRAWNADCGVRALPAMLRFL
jgi:hypothetical protein